MNTEHWSNVLHGHYSLARLNLSRSEETSGLDTDVEVKRQRRRREPVLSDNSDENNPASPSLPRPPVPAGLALATELLSTRGRCAFIFIAVDKLVKIPWHCV